MSYPFRLCLCNEMFQDRPFADTCKAIRAAGYDAIEIAPFTLSRTPREITAAQRREYRGIIRAEGLAFAGLHWLMVAPEGLHVTTADPALRERSWRHIEDLIDLCADLAGGPPEKPVMIFGSPKQRCTTPGVTHQQAARFFTDGLAGVAGHALARGVTVLVEALPANQCDVIQTLAEAIAVVDEISSPAIQTMFDSHNAVDESEPHAALIDRYFHAIRHIHLNEIDGRHPGASDYDFKPILETLARRRYSGWISIEVFDFTPGPETIAAESLRYLTGEIAKLPCNDTL